MQAQRVASQHTVRRAGEWEFIPWMMALQGNQAVQKAVQSHWCNNELEIADHSATSMWQQRGLRGRQQHSCVLLLLCTDGIQAETCSHEALLMQAVPEAEQIVDDAQIKRQVPPVSVCHQQVICSKWRGGVWVGLVCVVLMCGTSRQGCVWLRSCNRWLLHRCVLAAQRGTHPAALGTRAGHASDRHTVGRPAGGTRDCQTGQLQGAGKRGRRWQAPGELLTCLPG